MNRLLKINVQKWKWVYLLFGIGGLSDFFDLSAKHVAYTKVTTIFNLPISALQIMDLFLGVIFLVTFYLIWKEKGVAKRFALGVNTIMILWAFASAYYGLFVAKDHSTGFFSLIIGLFFIYLSLAFNGAKFANENFGRKDNHQT